MWPKHALFGSHHPHFSPFIHKMKEAKSHRVEQREAKQVVTGAAGNMHTSIGAATAMAILVAVAAWGL
jgi:hypothetical protein